MSGFRIGGREIGTGRPVYIVAELSANHRQDFEEAVELIKAAQSAGADAVKLQTYTPDTLTIDCDNAYFRIGEGSPWEGRTLHDLYLEAFTPWDWQPKLKQVANRLGLDLFSTAFDATAVDFLEEMDVPAYKVASFEVVDLPLLRRIAATGKPMILSTGMASLEEVEEAIDAVRGAGAEQIALLKCTSAYPAPPSEANLRAIPDLAERFGVPVGLSDHTLGIAVPTAAVALGACIIEKHFTLSRAVGSPDSAFSLEPDELAQMVAAIRNAEQALGKVHYGVSEPEKASLVFRRSLFIVKDVAAGEELTPENVRSIRPGHGLAPKFLPEVLHKRAARNLEKGTPLSWSDIVK